MKKNAYLKGIGRYLVIFKALERQINKLINCKLIGIKRHTFGGKWFDNSALVLRNINCKYIVVI